MTKNSSEYNDEIDLTPVLKTIWDEKIKIILIIAISILLGFNFPEKKSDFFYGSLEIKQSRNSQFGDYFYINNFLSEMNVHRHAQYKKNSPREISEIKSFAYNLNSEMALDNFINEFLRYKQLIFAIKQKDYTKKNISGLSENEQQKKLYNYAKFFKIEKIPNDTDKGERVFIKFKWHSEEEGVQILRETINLIFKKMSTETLNNLKKLTKLKKNFVIYNDLLRIEYLEEQADIANEMGIIKFPVNLIDVNATDGVSSSFTSKINVGGDDYYLRGTKAINKEINIIKNRKYLEYAEIQNQIESIKNNKNVNWVDYNLFLLEPILIIKSDKPLKLSILIGFALSFFYVVVSNIRKSKKIFK